jgi:hypothetical protein
VSAPESNPPLFISQAEELFFFEISVEGQLNNNNNNPKIYKRDGKE